MNTCRWGWSLGRKKASGFTLIELLVVIAIIALLIGILLPSLGKARNSARMAISLSNCRQMGTGAFAYSSDNKETWPMRPSLTPAQWLTVKTNPNIPNGWDTWSWGGNNTDEYWGTRDGGIFDEWASRRPLNAWIYPQYDFEPIDSTWGNLERKRLNMEAFRSPGDRFTYQRDPYGVASSAVDKGSYGDVGTSYHMNMKWWYDMMQEFAGASRTGGRLPAINQGTLLANFALNSRYFAYAGRRFSTGNGLLTSRVVWIHDQTADLVAFARDRQIANPNEPVMGEFGDVNKSVMTFLDGHAAYIDMIPNAVSGKLYQLTVALPQ